MKYVQLIAAVLVAGSLSAKDIEQHLSWQNLPQSLVGQKVEVLQADTKRLSGKLIRIEPDSLVLERRNGPVTIPRASTSRLQTKTRTRTRGRIIGVAVG